MLFSLPVQIYIKLVLLLHHLWQPEDRLCPICLPKTLLFRAEPPAAMATDSLLVSSRAALGLRDTG